jgi:hypothetical protein
MRRGALPPRDDMGPTQKSPRRRSDRGGQCRFFRLKRRRVFSLRLNARVAGGFVFRLKDPDDATDYGFLSTGNAIDRCEISGIMPGVLCTAST